MDFKEELSEDVAVEYQEVSETGGSELQIQFKIFLGKPEVDIIRLYDLDIIALRNYLNRLTNFEVLK